MAISRKGINQIGLSKKGTLLTTPTNKVVSGLKQTAQLKMAPFNQTKDANDRALRGKQNFSLAYKILQPNLLMLKDIIQTYLPDGGCDVEALATPQSAGVDGGCFQFAGSKFMGIEPKYVMGSKARHLDIKLDAAFNHSESQGIWDAADSNTPATFDVANYGIDYTKQRFPWIDFTDSDFSITELLNYMFELGVEGERSELDNRIMIDWITAKLEFTFKAATVPNVVAVMNRLQSPAVDFKQNTGDGTYEKFSFAANVLSLNTDPVIVGDDNRSIKLVYAGKFAPTQMGFDFDALKGGGTSADGTEGGTVSITL